MDIKFLENFLKVYRPSGFEKEGADVFTIDSCKLNGVRKEFIDKMWNACVSIGSDREDALKILIYIDQFLLAIIQFSPLINILIFPSTHPATLSIASTSPLRTYLFKLSKYFSLSISYTLRTSINSGVIL